MYMFSVIVQNCIDENIVPQKSVINLCYSVYIASLFKIPCYLLKLSSEKEKMDMSRADSSVKILTKFAH